MEITINSKFRDDEDKMANHLLQEYCDLSFLELRGFIASVICEPCETEQQEWLDLLRINNISKISNNNDGEDLEKSMIAYVQNCFNNIKNKLEHGIYDPIAEIKQLMIIDDDVELVKAAIAWSYGFMNGVEAGFLPSLTAKQKASLFTPMTILTLDDDQVEEALKENNINKTVSAARDYAAGVLTSAVNDVYQFWLNGDNIPSMQQSEQNNSPKDNKSFDDSYMVIH
jgi:hypothetical protein